MSTFNRSKFKEEILNHLRNSDIFTTTERSVTTTTDNFTATEGQTEFTMTNQNVRNIRSVEVNSVTQVVYTDYDIGISDKTLSDNQKITFYSGLSAGDTVYVQYDYGDSDKIFDDFSQDIITIKEYPRLMFDITSIANTNRSANDTLQQKNITFTFGAFSSLLKVDSLFQSMYDSIFNARFSFSQINLLRPNGESEIIPVDKTSRKVFMKECNFIAPTIFER